MPLFHKLTVTHVRKTIRDAVVVSLAPPEGADFSFVQGNVMRQVLSAVNYCHTQNIVHRDMKPENLLLDQSRSIDNIMVIDFGTSQTFQKNQKLR